MKKLVAAVLTGVLVAGTLSTGVYAKDDDKTITVAASATPHAEILEEAKPILEKEGSQIKITCRNNLPSYTVQGYSLLVLDKENKKEIRIPKLLPGMSWTTILEKGDVTVQIVRPNGEIVIEK